MTEAPNTERASGLCWRTKKKRFVTEEYAERVLADKPFAGRVYRCRHCRGFHLTTQLSLDSDFVLVDMDPREWGRRHGLILVSCARREATHRYDRLGGRKGTSYFRTVSAADHQMVIAVIRLIAWVNRGPYA